MSDPMADAVERGRDSASLFRFLVGSWSSSGPESVATMVAAEDREVVDRLLVMLAGREALR